MVAIEPLKADRQVLNHPLITVCLVTYNHAAFVCQALDSILAQRTTFAFDVLVMDDASTDGTQAILQSYGEKYPDQVRLVLNKKNIGKTNFINQFKRANSPYVAFLEGDDYWTSPDKLQTQVDFLEAHTDYAGCVHNVSVCHHEQPDALNPMCELSEPTVITLKAMAEKALYFHFSSYVFRNVFMGRLPRFYNHPTTGDWFFSMLHAQHGPIHYLPHCWSVYRQHQSGSWTRQTPEHNAMIRIDGLFHFNQCLGRQYQDEFYKLALWWTDALLKTLNPQNTALWHRLKYRAISYYLNYYFADYYGHNKAAMAGKARWCCWFFQGMLSFDGRVAYMQAKR